MPVWWNGTIVDKPPVDVADRGLTLGDGLFETVAVMEGKPCFMDRHLKRLRAGCALLAMPPIPGDDELEQAILQVLAARGLREAAVRITLTRGPAARGVLPPAATAPTLVIAAEPRAAAGPVEAIVATVTRRNEHSPLSRVKSTNYLDNILARQEAAAKGANEALLLNTAGRIAEASTANLFACIGGVLCTPPLEDGALPGVMRALVMEHRTVRERGIGVRDLDGASYAFLSSSLGLRPVRRIDGVALPDCSALLEQLDEDIRSALHSEQSALTA